MLFRLFQSIIAEGILPWWITIKNTALQMCIWLAHLVIETDQNLFFAINS